MYDCSLKLAHWPQGLAGIDILCRLLQSFDSQQLQLPQLPTLRSVGFKVRNPAGLASSERLFQQLLQLPRELEELELEGCVPGPAQLRQLLARFRSLRKLGLVDKNRSSPLANTDFAGCAGLHVLDVSGFASIGLGLLTHLDGVRELYLRDCGWNVGPGTTDISLPDCALQTLWVEGLRSVISLRDLPPLRRLQTLIMDDLPAGQTIDLEQLELSELSELKELSITFKRPISVTSPARLSNYYL
eukprot:g12250.t1